MPDLAPNTATADPSPAPQQRGPKTPEGKARSSMNALEHGLRAKSFRLLPEESGTAFAAFVRRLEATYAPEDASEQAAIEALATAFWQASRADAQEAAVLVALRAEASVVDGLDLIEAPAPRAALATVLRYQAAAQNAARRALDLFLKHRKAKRAGLFAPRAATAAAPVPAPAAEDTAGAGETGTRDICTNELSPRPSEPEPPGRLVEPAPPEEDAAVLPPVEADPAREAARLAILASL
ncbi:hypothetical protein, partial [Benzoatithermus flavus]